MPTCVQYRGDCAEGERAVVALNVVDNKERVTKADVLFVIDRDRFEIEIERAKANRC